MNIIEVSNTIFEKAIDKFNDIMKTYGLKYLGSVEFGNEIFISDPYYAPSKLNIKLSIEPGLYYGFINEEYGIVYGNKIKELYIFNSNYTDYPLELIYDELSVSNGECGFFDSNYFESSIWRRLDFTNDLSNRIHDITHPYSDGRLLYGGIIDNRCVVSASTIGDIKYKIYVSRNSKGNIVAVKLEY